MKEDSVKETYDKLADAYDKEVDHSSPYNTDYERPAMVAEIAENLNGLRVLDAGCAAGWYSVLLLERGANVSAVDISPEMVKVAQKRVQDKAEVICHDLSKPYPWPDNEFDLIICSLTLHYIEDWIPVMKGFSRVLKPGGTLLFSVHHPFMDFHKFEESNDYFKKQLLSDEWIKQGKTIQVSFYRRAMQDIINDVSTHFQIKKIVEPKPVPAFCEKAKTAYRYLMTNPHFLIVKATKKELGT